LTATTASKKAETTNLWVLFDCKVYVDRPEVLTFEKCVWAVDVGNDVGNDLKVVSGICNQQCLDRLPEGKEVIWQAPVTIFVHLNIRRNEPSKVGWAVLSSDRADGTMLRISSNISLKDDESTNKRIPGITPEIAHRRKGH
jgi:hypothetical protein